ncbi:unnamed protein product, partial [Polarella glacialis]
LAYVLGGVDGLVELLRAGQAMTDRDGRGHCVQQAAAWAVYELALQQLERGKAGASEWSQSDVLVALLLDAMRSRRSPPPLELLWACCSALRQLTQEQPCRGSLFVERGGDEALLAALGLGQGAKDAEGEALLVAGMQLMTSLVE